jgi:hypothetical protein
MSDEHAIRDGTADYGALRRTLLLSSSDHCSRAELEDDFHHLLVELRHDRQRVTAIRGETLRAPWDTCGAATAVLGRLVGSPIDMPLAFSSAAERYAHCTHLLDLAQFAIAQAGRPHSLRRYQAESWPARSGSARATLYRNGTLLFDWEVREQVIVSAGTCQGARTNELPHWGRSSLSADDLEAALVLRRAMHVSRGRRRALAGLKRASDIQPPMPPTCHSYQTDVIAVAQRTVDAVRDFYGEGVWPLADRVATGTAA